MNIKQITLTLLFSLLSGLAFILTGLFVLHFLPAHYGYGSILARVQPFACLAGLLILLIGARYQDRSTRLHLYFGIRSVRWRIILLWMMAIAFANLLLFIIVGYFPNAFRTFWDVAVFKTTRSIPLLLLYILLIGPLFEELLIRGYLWQGLNKAHVPVFAIIVVTSIIWALLHVQYSFTVMLLIALFGVIFGIARWKTNSIITTFWMHFAFNGLQILNYFIVD